jgi:predicted transcriptional regulator of viral defense system
MRHGRGSNSTPPVDARVAALAGRQHGVVAFRQLRSIGLGRDAIAYRVNTGRLHCIHRGVYAVGHPLVSLKGQFMAATLACGDGAAISHRPAAHLHGLLTFNGTRIDVSSPRRVKPRRALETHQTRTLAPHDLTTVERIPVTSVARTLLDLAAVAPQRHVERALDQAEILRVFDLMAIDDVLARANGRSTKRLEAALQKHRDDGPTFTRSELEEAFLKIIDDAGLPRPAMNTQVCGFEVDAYWREHGLVVEIDSYRYHRTRRAFEADRRRDIALQAAGLRIARFSDRRIDGEPQAVAKDLERLVDSGPPLSS